MRSAKWSVLYYVFRSIIVGLSLFLVSCTPEAEEVMHTKRLSRVEAENVEYRLTYNEEGKLETVSAYDRSGSVKHRYTNTYDTRGYLVQRLFEEYGFTVETIYWKETFAYDKGELVNGYYRRLDTGEVKIGYRNHEIVLNENNIQEYAQTTYLYEGIYYRVIRGHSAGGNVDWQEKAFEASPNLDPERWDITYDDKRNPFHGIGFYDPFTMEQSNANNILEKRITGNSKDEQIDRFSYTYEDGYPISRITDTYNGSEELLFSSTTRYFYE